MRFFRVPTLSIELEGSAIYHGSAPFNAAVVRVIDGLDEAMVYGAELKGVYIHRIKFEGAKFTAACEDLSQPIRYCLVDVPKCLELMAELNVFRSDFTYLQKPDYSLQARGQAGINALSLVTYDLEPTMWNYQPAI